MADLAKYSYSQASFDTTQAIATTVKELETAFRMEHVSSYLPLQREFGIFGTLAMNRKGKMVARGFHGSPALVQPDVNCSWTPTKTLSDGTVEVDPKEVKVQEELCLKTDMSGAFAAFDNWGNDGRQHNEQLLDDMIDEIQFNTAAGVRIQNLIGSLYAADTALPTLEANEIDAFGKTKATIEGVLVKLMATSVNDTSLMAAGETADGNFTGNALQVIDNLKASASRKLQRAVNRGGIQTRDGRKRPVVLATDSFYAKLMQETIEQGVAVAQNKPRLEHVVSEAGNGDYIVVDGSLLVIMVDDLNAYDHFVGKDLYGAVLTVCGVISVGLSYTPLDTVFQDEPDIAMVVERPMTGTDAGKVLIKSEALIGGLVINPELVSMSLEARATA